jgi:glycerophosphoryl diester phosphodiesterase
VPTLDEVCVWARASNILLNIEIKLSGIETAVAQTVRTHQMVEQVIISSFDQTVLRVMHEVAPELERGVLMGTQSYAPNVRLREAWPIPALRLVEAHAWHPAGQLPLLDQVIPRVRQAGYAVNVWTIDDPAMMRRFLSLNVDGIITNRPALLRDVIREQSAAPS